MPVVNSSQPQGAFVPFVRASHNLAFSLEDGRCSFDSRTTAEGEDAMIRYPFLALLALSSALATAGAFSELDLEPCINGAVSAKGQFPEQALEDAVLSLTNGPLDAYALEPCMNGGVSASGRYVDQSVEDAVEALIVSND
jgi:hypothetical protein